MSNFIIERNLVDKIEVDGYKYLRRIIFTFSEPPKFEIIWYEYYSGKRQIKDKTLYSKLEQIYRNNRDRVHGYEAK